MYDTGGALKVQVPTLYSGALEKRRTLKNTGKLELQMYHSSIRENIDISYYVLHTITPTLGTDH